MNRSVPGTDHSHEAPMQRGQDHILDELLVLRSQEGGRAALDLLLTRWRTRLHQRAHWLCGDRDGADEITQRTMIAIARGIGRLHDPAAFGGWAMRIVAHKSSDWLRERRRRRGREAALDSATPLHRADATPGPADAPHAGEAADMARRVGLALERLAPDRRAILVLHYAHAVSVEGLGRALGIPTGTAKSRLFHARRDLRRELERHQL